LSGLDDFEDWIQRVSKKGNRRNENFFSKQTTKFSHIFQIGLENWEKEKLIFFASTYVKKDGKWGEIKSKIRLYPNLDQEKNDQLW
jgi:hypothetical protein